MRKRVNRERQALLSRIHDINEAVVAKDLDTLRKLSIGPNGFMETGIRQRVWPLLLDLHSVPLLLSHSFSHQGMKACLFFLSCFFW